MKYQIPGSLLILALGCLPLAANADSGFYIGGAAGGATLEADIGDSGIPQLPSSIDEDDTAFKVFAGYKFDLPVLDLGIEAGFVDFGAPEIDTSLGQIEIDPTGVNLWGIAGIDAGPIDLYAKVGYIMWDVEVSSDIAGLGDEFSDDGSDIGYGLGLSFGIGSVRIRGEFEAYDLEDADLSMLSVGILYQFN
ncbi:MAG: outer membrane beta-barrel protein [Woeseiaceae bacterium]|nr:outer membrane beta-barrel protein [Woeseiaceae bacterium]